MVVGFIVGVLLVVVGAKVVVEVDLGFVVVVVVPVVSDVFFVFLLLLSFASQNGMASNSYFLNRPPVFFHFGPLG